MTNLPFQLPDINERLSPTPNGVISLANAISRRRSTPIKMMNPDGAGPEGAVLENILSAAMRVPDHRKLEPWRMIVIKGNARLKLGKELAERYLELHPDASDASLIEETNRLLRAPVCVTVVSSPDHAHKTPVWEQELSAGALCMNLLYAAHASGFAASWISEWWAFDPEIDRVLGLTENERIAGHIFLGTALGELAERPRPSAENKVSYF
ncbi:MAG: nitroreductase [Ponticaulis sp.]|nr:nitroreductase [Ponticaulis sp.]|tara:strand:- start:23887 stop:24519 length:633 start_codon:yes stop_codon:yes gene_type:complete